MGLLREYLRMQDPRYAQQQQQAAARQEQERINAENRQQLSQYLGSVGSPAVGAGNDFGDDHLAAQGVSLPGEIEGYGYLGSDRGDAAKMQFASNLLGMNSPEMQRVGGAALQGYIQPSKQQELVGQLRQYKDAIRTGVIPPDMPYQQFLQMGKSAPVTIHTGSQPVRKRLSREDAKNLIHRDTGEHPMVGAYEDEIYDGGEHRWAGTEQQKAIRAEAGYEDAIAPLDDLITRSGGILDQMSGGGGVGVLKDYIKSEYQQFSQSNPDYKLLNDLMDSIVPAVAKARGHTGTLSDVDFEAIRRSLPGSGDSKEVFRRKWDIAKGELSKSQAQNNDPLGIR